MNETPKMRIDRLQIRRIQHRVQELDPGCISCTLPENDALTFAATSSWKIVLHPDQTVPGALLLTSLRHVAKVSELTADESAEWFSLFRAVEPALETCFGAELINVSCERNWAYRSPEPNPPFKGGKPNPHVHWHVAPRYSEPVEVGDEVFNDTDFGDPLIWSERTVTPATTAVLIDSLFDHLAARPGVDVVENLGG